ncbi:MAG: YbgC/FadM family acyl-CoA thioesterase [Sphingomonas sp.]|nr:YbgC/FadM family acyl-CoA thioesterase [Sphingomonas sp.]
MTDCGFDKPYRGGFVAAEHHFALTVYFEDTDAYGIVYYANYLKFMERARSDMLRACGIDQEAELARSGSAYAVVEAHLRYRRPAKLGDDLRILSTIDEVRGSSVEIQQRVMRGDEMLNEGRITAAFLDGSGRPRRHPKEWVDRFMALGSGS